MIGISFNGSCNGYGVRRIFDMSNGYIGLPVSSAVRTTRYRDDWRADFDRTWSGRILGTGRIELERGELRLHTADGILSFVRQN